MWGEVGAIKGVWGLFSSLDKDLTGDSKCATLNIKLGISTLSLRIPLLTILRGM